MGSLDARDQADHVHKIRYNLTCHSCIGEGQSYADAAALLCTALFRVFDAFKST